MCSDVSEVRGITARTVVQTVFVKDICQANGRPPRGSNGIAKKVLVTEQAGAMILRRRRETCAALWKKATEGRALAPCRSYLISLASFPSKAAWLYLRYLYGTERRVRVKSIMTTLRM